MAFTMHDQAGHDCYCCKQFWEQKVPSKPSCLCGQTVPNDSTKIRHWYMQLAHCQRLMHASVQACANSTTASGHLGDKQC